MQITLSILTFTHGVLKIKRRLNTPTVAVDRPPWGFLTFNCIRAGQSGAIAAFSRAAPSASSVRVRPE